MKTTATGENDPPQPTREYGKRRKLSMQCWCLKICFFFRIFTKLAAHPTDNKHCGYSVPPPVRYSVPPPVRRTDSSGTN